MRPWVVVKEPASWAVRVRDREEAQQVLEAAQLHNEEELSPVGEQLACQGLLEFEGQTWLLLGSAGGEGHAATSAWLSQHLPPALEVLWPFADKPEGWEESSEYVWRPVAASGALPEAVPLGELPLAPWAEEEPEPEVFELEEGSECAG
ncbi:hypothetical protein ABPG75_012656 [Micractinium tetrahymenae]